MRVQILPLPPITLGDATHVPFVVAFDHIDHPTSMTEITQMRRLAESWGARGVILSGDGESIEISPHLELPEQLQQALIQELDLAVTKENS